MTALDPARDGRVPRQSNAIDPLAMQIQHEELFGLQIRESVANGGRHDGCEMRERQILRPYRGRRALAAVNCPLDVGYALLSCCG